MDPITILFVATGLLAAFSFAGKNIRDTFLASDSDGFQPLLLGIVLALLGLGVGLFDVTGGLLLKGLGVLFVGYGAFVLLPEGITDFLVNPVAGIVYTVVSLWAFFSVPATMAVTTAYVMRLVAPTFIAAMFATLGALAFTSDSFKDHLSQQVGGGIFAVVGLAFGALALTAGTFELAIIASGLGGLLFILGVLVLVGSDTVEGFLTTKAAFVWLPLMAVAGAFARFLF